MTRWEQNTFQPMFKDPHGTCGTSEFCVQSHFCHFLVFYYCNRHILWLEVISFSLTYFELTQVHLVLIAIHTKTESNLYSGWCSLWARIPIQSYHYLDGNRKMYLSFMRLYYNDLLFHNHKPDKARKCHQVWVIGYICYVQSFRDKTRNIVSLKLPQTDKSCVPEICL